MTISLLFTDATIMPKSKKNAQNNLLARLRADYPNLEFLAGERFLFHPPATIYYEVNSDDYLSLLHELGHALIGQNDYNQDVELLQIESAAWAKAKELCAKYHLTFDESYAESRLDSYRDLLHYNSLCPNCSLNGYEDEHQTYHCPLCGASWQSKYKAE